MKYTWLIFMATAFLMSCQSPPASDSTQKTAIHFQNRGHELVYHMTQKVGDYQALLDKKDVVYTYTYETPDSQKDISTEKYMFDGELSYGSYQQHERTLPQVAGTIEQGYNGSEFWLRHKGEYLTDEDMLKRVQFNRKTNFYWFAMFQKLLDPGLQYEYLKEESIGDQQYELVKVSFHSEDGKPTDVYQLYINQQTSLVDQFLFTIVDFNIVEFPMLMQVEYEEVDGLLIPGKRQYKKSTWDAEVSSDPWIKVSWSEISFDNQLTRSQFDQ